MKFLTLICLSLFSSLLTAAEVDCSEAYGGKAATCEAVTCDAKYASFIGKWTGPFSAFERELSNDSVPAYRPFKNEVSYSESDCLKNKANGETFIIGRRSDKYPAFKNLPAKQVRGLLITGKSTNGAPFLRTIDDDGLNSYTLVYKNEAANLSIWDLTIPAQGNTPEMHFTVIDGQDFSETKAHKRNVTVTMSIGTPEAPIWQGVVSSGYHSLGN